MASQPSSAVPPQASHPPFGQASVDPIPSPIVTPSHMAPQQQSLIDPYALHPLDHLGLDLVSQPLQEDNFASWSHSIRLALSGKRKLGFIDGNLPKPDPLIDLVLLNLGNAPMILSVLCHWI